MATINEIARHAGVSTATVSRTLDPRFAALVASRTRERILIVCRKYGYRPDFSGQALRQKTQRAIGVLLPFASGHYGELMIHLDRQLVAGGYCALFSFWDTASEAEFTAAFERLLRRKVDGIITTHYINLPPHGQTPVVLYGNERDDFECVYPDKAAFGREVIAYLHRRNFRKVCAVGRPLDDRRYPAMRRAAAESGIEYREFECSERNGSAPRALLASSDRPEAVICHSDPTARNVYACAARLGLRIPEDLSVVSFDNLEESANMFPALTAFDQNMALAAQLLTEAMLERIAAPESPLKKHGFKTPLVERESVINKTQETEK